ncbi:MAG: LacI family DNA-binding transcriptional regulator [Actinomycetota bacterium]
MSVTEPPVRIEDVARAAGVSITTVSHALSGKGRLAEATRERVRAKAGELGYRPNAAAQSLAGGKTGILGTVVSAPGDAPITFTEIDYYVELMNAATRAAVERGYALVLAPSTAGHELLGRVPLDGVIVIDPAEGDLTLGALRRRGTPIVFVGRDPHGTSADLVVENDRRTGTRTVLDHLVAEGADHVGVLTLRTFESFTEDCLAEYAAWCAERGAEPSTLVAPVEPTAGPSAFRAIAESFLDGEGRPRGVFCLYERLAVELLGAARDRGLRVPGDLRIATISEMGWAESTDPMLTTLEINQDLLGATAADLLADLVEGGPAVSVRDVPTRLVVRGSSCS